MKPEIILFATVQGSGARFLIEKHDMKLLHYVDGVLEELNPGGNVLHLKLFDANMPQIMDHIAAGGEVWTTNRKDEDIRASWVRRGKDLVELERQLANRNRILPFAKVLELPGNLTRLTAADKKALL